MTDKILTPKVSRDYQPVALLELDIDPLAERYMLINRISGKLLTHGFKPISSNIKKLFFRPSLSINSDLTVIIFDDNGEYNAAIADGVQLQLVDANQVDL